MNFDIEDFIESPKRGFAEFLFKNTSKFSDECRIDNQVGWFRLITIKLTFGQTQQAKFLEHFLSIRGKKGTIKQAVEILPMMIELYSESNAIGSGVSLAVANLLFERVGDGYNIDTAMEDVFDSQFTVILRAMSSKKSSDELNAAVSQATKDTVELVKVRRSAKLKLAAGFVSMYLASLAAAASKSYYESVMAGNPKADEFIDIPHTLYNVGSAIASNQALTFAILITLLVAHSYMQNNWLGSYRSEADRILPTFVLHRYIAGLTVFSGLSLMVSTLKYESLAALNALRPTFKPYEKMHIDRMIAKLEEGDSGTDQLNTGLLTKELELTLKMAGKGENSSIRTAIEIINRQGRESITKTIRYTSLVIMISMIISSVMVLLMVGTSVAFLFQAELGI